MWPDLLDAAFRLNIAALTNSRHSSAAIDDMHWCGRELDPIALGVDDPYGVRALNLSLMRMIRPTRAAAAVISAKNEGCYLLECVAHYRAIGFEHVFIYTNDNTDGSKALLDALDRAGCVTVICNEVGRLASPQVKAYEHSIHLLRALRDFEWVSYFDMDEFLIPAKYHDYSVVNAIAAFKRRYPDHCGPDRGGATHRSRPSAICYNWHSYGSQGQIRQRDGLVQERFTHSAAHQMVKSLVRLADICTMAEIHKPGPEELTFVNAAFDPILLGPYCMTPPPDAVHGKLNHYYQKSFEEFAIKSDRGRGGAPGGLEGKGFDTFFAWDVSPTSANHHPTPLCLLTRLHAQLAALLAMPGVAAAAHEAREAQRALSQRVSDEGVEVKFHQMRTRFPKVA